MVEEYATDGGWFTLNPARLRAVPGGVGSRKIADSTSSEEPGADDSVLGPPAEWGPRRILAISLRLLGRAGYRGAGLFLMGVALALAVVGVRWLAPGTPRLVPALVGAVLGTLWCWYAQALLGPLLVGEETDLAGAAATLIRQLPRLLGLAGVVTGAGALAWGLVCALLTVLAGLDLPWIPHHLVLVGVTGLLLDLVIRVTAFASLEILTERRDPVGSMLRSLELAPAGGEGLASWFLAGLGTWALVAAAALALSVLVPPSPGRLVLPALTGLVYVGAMVLGQAVWVTAHQGRVRGRASPQFMSPVEGAICVAILVVMAGIAMPHTGGRGGGLYAYRGCTAMQRQVEGALEVFQLDRGRTVTALDPALWKELVEQGYLRCVPGHRGQAAGAPPPLRLLPAEGPRGRDPRVYCLEHGFSQTHGERAAVASAHEQLWAHGVRDPARLEEASRREPTSPSHLRLRPVPWLGLPLWLPAALLACPPPWGLGVALLAT